MAKHKHFFNMYLTTTVSVAMVLLLLGLEAVILLSAHSVIGQVKDNVAITLVLTSDADSVSEDMCRSYLNDQPYTRSLTFISREQALQEHIVALGEDPTEFLGYNPLRDSYELYLTQPYVQADSIQVIVEQLKTLPYVEKVVYQKDLLDFMSRNLGDLTWILLTIALILLIIAQALIINTIRLQIYSKRFLIKTMTLVGATAATIKGPFLRKNILMGFIAALLALSILTGLLYVVHVRLGIILFPLTWQNIAFIVGSVLILGLLIVIFASLFACDKYIRMNTDKLYEV